MHKRKTVHILSHTHWDREWYLESKYTNEWLVPFFENLFKMLEREPSYKFILDGQMCMIDDWLDQLLRTNRSIFCAKRRIRKYVEQGRLVIGPYYLQPDWQLVSGEALVRNLVIGHKMAAELGGAMKIGWLLDNFGQISQTVQIHAQCGLRGLFVWRGVYMDPEKVKSEFIWKSPDGTALPCIYLINSYRNAMRLAEDPELAKQRIDDEVARMDHFNTTSHVLLMNGYDQDIEPDDILSVLRQLSNKQTDWQVVQSTPEEYLNAVLAEKPDLPTLEGAQYVGRFISVFPGVMSARIYLKQQNDRSQHSLERVLEPLSALNYLFGGEYEAGFIESLWKLLLKNHPHDSICGVSVDPVYTDMENRHYLIQRLAGEHIERSLGEMCTRIDTSAVTKHVALIAFNTSIARRSAVIRYNDRFISIDDIPGMGWKVIDPHATSNPGNVWTSPGNQDFVFKAGNGLVEIRLHPDGSFDLWHQATNATYCGLGILEDAGDAGDLYNYSRPDRDLVIDTRGKTADIRLIHASDIAAEFRIETVLRIPEGLSDDGKGRSSRMIDLPVVSLLRLETGSPIVKINTRLRNTAKNHVLRVLFPSGLSVDHSHGGSPFDVTRRPLDTGDFDESSLPLEVKAVIIGAREPKSNAFFLGQYFADVSDDQRGLSVLNRGLPEYQVRRDDATLVLTLFRSVSIIAGEINSRIGDAGPQMLTPDGQCLRDMNFEYAVFPHIGNVHAGAVAFQADDFAHPVVVAETMSHSGSLLSFGGECEILEGSVIMSAFKRAERGAALILRVFNPSESATSVLLKFGRPLEAAWRCNLLEQRQERLSESQSQFLRFELGAKAIQTLELQLAPRATAFEAITPAVLLDEDNYENFSAWNSVPEVSEAEMYSELARAALLSNRIDDIMYRRSALEARISAILTRSRYEQQDLRRLGLELNDARVKRRLHDYIATYKKS